MARERLFIARFLNQECVESKDGIQRFEADVVLSDGTVTKAHAWQNIQHEHLGTYTPLHWHFPGEYDLRYTRID